MGRSPDEKWAGAGDLKKRPWIDGSQERKTPYQRERVMEGRILVVDDEKEIRDFLFKALTRFGGFRVDVAENGEEGLKKVKEGRYDLVLTDLKMPGLDGLQLISEIAKDKPEVLTVLMTGHGTVDSAVEAMKQGASDYLLKPLNLDETIVRIKKVLEEKQRFMRLKDFADQLEKANQELRRIDAMKSEFISIASHELRTPLAAIKNAIQLILQGKTGEINEHQTKFLAIADRNINRLINIINDLLDLSRIESGRISMKFESLPIKPLFETVVTSLQPQAEAKSIRIEIDLPEDPPSVYADKEKVEQILVNLIGNAIKFTPEGGMIRLRAQVLSGEKNPEHPKKVAISVEDNGIGIPSEHLDKIFDKFHQVDDSLHRSVGGTGLGLAITRGLVEAHQGKIWVESGVGKGSTFTFTLPFSKGERRDLSFRRILDREFHRALENQTPLTLLLIKILGEIDEKTLTLLEEKIKHSLCRKGDILFRKENEKVLVALCEADPQGAQIIRQRIEEDFKKTPLSYQGKPLGIRVGMATYPQEALSKRELFRKAKERLKEET